MSFDPKVFNLTVAKLRALGLSPQSEYPQELHGVVGPKATALGVLVPDEEWAALVNALPSPPSKQEEEDSCQCMREAMAEKVEIDSLVAVTFPQRGEACRKFWTGLTYLDVPGLSITPMMGKQTVIFPSSRLSDVIKHAKSCGLEVDDVR